MEKINNQYLYSADEIFDTFSPAKREMIEEIINKEIDLIFGGQFKRVNSFELNNSSTSGGVTLVEKMDEKKIQDAMSTIVKDWAVTATEEAWESVANELGVDVEDLKKNI